jgi:hypothetical protein
VQSSAWRRDADHSTPSSAKVKNELPPLPRNAIMACSGTALLYFYIIGKCWLVACWLVCDHLLLRDFGSYGIILMNLCVVITVAVVMLLRDFGLYDVIL